MPLHEAKPAGPGTQLLQGTLPMDFFITSKGNSCPAVDRVIRVGFMCLSNFLTTV